LKGRDPRPILEFLEDRLAPTANWNNFGGNAQHTDVAQVTAQPIDHLLWEVPLDLAPWGAIHYGDPIFTPNNVVVVPIKVTWDANNQGLTNFFEVGINDVTGAVLWSTAPTGSLTGATNVGNTIVITTNNTTGLANGNTVTVGDMNGDTAANTGSSNKTFVISNVTSNSFTLDNVTGNGTYTGGGMWVLSTTSSASTSYIEPHYSWLPPNQAAYDPVTDRVFFPGPGGTIDYISNPDTATGIVTPVQMAFYGTSNYNANVSAYDSSIYINTPLTVDTQGNVYFGFTETGTNPSGITDGGIARISTTGVGTYELAYLAVGQGNDGNWNPALGSAPAVSDDGSILYLGINDSGYSLGGSAYNSYLVGLNSTTLAPVYSVRLFDPATGSGVPSSGVQNTGNGAGLVAESSASPMVAPDGSVFLGIFGSNYDGSRGSLLHYSGNLQTEYTAGAFGWDDTPSIIPTSMVPSYTGSSSYLILSKYNNYANAEVGTTNGGNGVNEIAVLDPYASQPDPNNDPKPNGQVMPVMKQIMTFASPSPDLGNINGGDPNAVREWCTNGSAVDPATDSIYVNDEDGYTYQWNLGTNTITNTVEVSPGYGVPYTPTAISPNGEIFSDNGGTLFALGGYSNYTISDVSSANPAVYGTPITFTTTLASTTGGPTPTGTVTFTAYAGINNPLNYNTTPISLGTVTVVSGVATFALSASQSASELLAAHYHVIASYSGDSNYSAGLTTFVLPVQETATTSVSASANPVANGSSVTFTATVMPNGTPATVVQNGTGSSNLWVPTGTVTFMNGSSVLGTVTLNPLENATYASTYVQQVTITTSSLPVGTDTITAVYSGDQNFVGGTSAIFNETVGGTTTNVVSSLNPSAYGETVTLTATVSPLVGSNTPGGTVTFMDGSTTLGTATLSGGSATFSSSVLSVGQHTITVSYGGDTNDAASTSNPLIQTVNPSWNNFGGNAQHTDVAQVAAQPIDHLLWEVPLDLAPWGAIHYGDPIFTANNVVVVPIKVTWGANNQGLTNFFEVGINDVTGALLWSTAPTGSITGATNVGNTIVITTNNTNGLVSGDSVTIGDMNGDTAANTGSSNKTFVISNVTSNSFTLDNVTGNGTYTGGGMWVLSTSTSASTSYIEPSYSWLPPDQAAYDPISDRVYFPGPGGTIDYISNPDTATGVVTPVQVAFYGTSNYTANESAYNASIYINTPLTVDTLGNVYFGYEVTGSNPSGITKGGIARISASGAVTYESAFAAADTDGQTPTDDGNWTAALGSAPALSNDGSMLYIGVDDGGYSLSSGGEHNSYLVGLNSTTLAPVYSVHLLDPTTGSGVPSSGVQTTGNGAGLIDQSSASPMVAPDGSVFFGVFGYNYDGSRGSLLHFSGSLATEYAPGAFGWDDTASIIPTSMVPSYTGTSAYLILSKYNNYDVGGTDGGNGVNEIAILDPYATQPDPNYDPEPTGQPMQVMKQIMTLASPSPDKNAINSGYQDGVREWCTNGTAVDPATDSIFVNNEDGYTYQWNLGTNTITNAVEVTKGYGVPYTPTAISPNGEVFSDNGGTLFALGGYSNYTINTVPSADPAVVGNPITFTTTLASTSGGPTPTGSITYSYTSGANNPLNTPGSIVILGTVPLVNGAASYTATGLPAAHYHVVASYSGDSNYVAGQTTFVEPILANTTTSVTSSSNPSVLGSSVTFTATVTPTSTSFVPLGTVTFMDGSTVLGTATLNPFDGQAMSTAYNQATFTTSALSLGTHSITVSYAGDLNFADSTSSVLTQTVGVATHFTVLGTSSSTAGGPFSLTVTALDVNNNVVTTYQGTVHFTTTDSGTGVVVPVNYTFVAGDNGVHTFTNGFVLVTAGSQTITATDTLTSSITGNATVQVNPAAASTFVVTGFTSPVTAGTSGMFSVTAKDPYNNTATGYVGTVHFTSSDGQAALPANYTITSGDNGVHTFSGTLKTAGTESITATDTVTGSITGSQSGITVNPAAASTFVVTGFASPVTAGTSGTFSVTARDPYNNTATGYVGTVHFTSSDGQAALPANYMFTSGDSGVHTFSGTLKTAGTESITVTDTVTGSITGSQSGITVNPAAASTFVVTGFTSPVTAGTSGMFSVTAKDPYNNTATGYVGTVHFTSSDGQAALPANYTFTSGDSGVHTFSGTLKTAGTESITATDTVTSSITGSQTGITVNAGALSALAVSGFPSPVTAGTASTFTVKAVDAYGNTVTSYRDAVTFTSTDVKASLPANYTFSSTDQGVHTFTATLKTAGTKSITATDRTTSSVTGTDSGITVNAGAAVALTVTVFPTPDTAGVTHTVAVTAVDAYGNAAASYGGTIHFTSSDAQAVLPANYTFVASDNGVHTFQASTTLKTAGLQSITATDTVTSSLTGSEANITVNPAAAHTLTVVGFPSPAVTGVAGNFTVTAKDPYGNTATGYTGIVAFTSSDSLAVLPGHATLTSGVGTFSATFNTVGTQSLTATDTVSSSITGSQTGIVVSLPATVVTEFLVTGFSTSVTAGQAGTITVTAENSLGQTVTSYTGTVYFTSSDSQAALPANYTFTSSDRGAHTFSVTLKTAGTQSVTATDTVSSSILGSQTGINVNSAAASTFVVSGYPSTVVVGTPSNFTVTAKDAYNNTATGYAGTVAFSSSDPSASLPANSTLTNGAGTFSATLNTLGTQSLTATDTLTASITGSQTGILVINSSSAVVKFVVTGFPLSITAGTAGTITVTAENSSGQTVTTYAGTVFFTSSDGQALLPANYTFTNNDNGVHTFGLTLKTAGTQSITVTDSVMTSATGSQTGITVIAGAVSGFIVSGFPSPVAAGVTGGFTVQSVDAYGNLVATYQGSVTFSSTDVKAVLPSNYTFTSADQGVHSFSATLKTAGTKSITVTDRTTNSITGTDSGITVNAGVAVALTVTVFPTPDTAGATHTVAVTAVDVYGNAAPSYRGTIHFTSTDSKAVLPANYTFVASDNGVHKFMESTTLKTAGIQSITATDTVTSSITGSETNITVNPAPAAVFVVSGFPGLVIAGTAHTFTVTAMDAYGNVATGYTGTVHFTSSDSMAALPANYTFTAVDNGSHTLTATLNTAGAQSITATDTSKSTITGTQFNIKVEVIPPGILFPNLSYNLDEADTVPDLMETRRVLDQVARAMVEPMSLLEAAQHDSAFWEGAGIDKPQASWAAAALGLLWWSRSTESKEDSRKHRGL